MKILVKSKGRLSLVGWVGAALFVACPTVAAIAVALTLENADSAAVYFPLRSLVILCVVFFLVGAVMLLVGREHDQQIDVEGR